MTDITYELACKDDCLDMLVPSDLRKLVIERDRLRAELDALKSQAPIAYMYEYTWPMDGSPFWRRDSQEWYGQQAKSSRPLYAKPMPSIPDGYQLVPIEPTNEMILAAQSYPRHMPPRATYRLMLAAAKEGV